MAEVSINFEREKREGIVPVGTYLFDAAGRFGIRIDHDFENESADHSCSVVVQTGSQLLSPLTKIEREQFARSGRRTNERLACQAKIDKPGEIIIMTDETKKESEEKGETTDANERFRKEFEDMPLEKKIANLLQLEFMAFGETVSFVFNSPYKIFDKMMDVMAEFGLKKDEEAKKAGRPEEHDAKPRAAAKDAKTDGSVTGGQDAPAAG